MKRKKKKNLNVDKKKEKLKELSKSEGLFIGTPIHSEVSLHYMKSCLDLQKECLLNGINLTFQLMKSSLVTQGRNLIVSAFLESDANQLCFIDSDIAFGVRGIYRLFECDHEVACIAYPMKTQDPNKYRKDDNRRPDDDPNTKGLVFPVEMKDTNNINVDKGFVTVNKAPTGCMMIKRSAFEKLIKAYPDLFIKQQTFINGQIQDRPNYYNFFDTYYCPETKTYSGEDFGFCRLWNKIGGQVHVIVDEELMHIGEYAYTGKLIQEFTKK
tara:strand:- start:509 stop:1315 length:807 start_codon:yes stop_codon:yes gene_type:complete